MLLSRPVFDPCDKGLPDPQRLARGLEIGRVSAIMAPCASLMLPRQVKQYLASHWLLVDKLTPVIQVNLQRVEVNL